MSLFDRFKAALLVLILASVTGACADDATAPSIDERDPVCVWIDGVIVCD